MNYNELSVTQRAVVDRATANGMPRMVALKGGYWTFEGTSIDSTGTPEWWVMIRTVRALQRKGYLDYCHEIAKGEWNDPRKWSEWVMAEYRKELKV